MAFDIQLRDNGAGSFDLALSSGAPVTGLVMVWSGSAWTEKPVKVWTGTDWAQKPLKRWNGTAWI